MATILRKGLVKVASWAKICTGDAAGNSRRRIRSLEELVADPSRNFTKEVRKHKMEPDEQPPVRPAFHGVFDEMANATEFHDPSNRGDNYMVAIRKKKSKGNLCADRLELFNAIRVRRHKQKTAQEARQTKKEEAAKAAAEYDKAYKRYLDRTFIPDWSDGSAMFKTNECKRQGCPGDTAGLF